MDATCCRPRAGSPRRRVGSGGLLGVSVPDRPGADPAGESRRIRPRARRSAARPERPARAGRTVEPISRGAPRIRGRRASRQRSRALPRRPFVPLPHRSLEPHDDPSRDARGPPRTDGATASAALRRARHRFRMAFRDGRRQRLRHAHRGCVRLHQRGRLSELHLRGVHECDGPVRGRGRGRSLLRDVPRRPILPREQDVPDDPPWGDDAPRGHPSRPLGDRDGARPRRPRREPTARERLRPQRFPRRPDRRAESHLHASERIVRVARRPVPDRGRFRDDPGVPPERLVRRPDALAGRRSRERSISREA